jgi:prepilin-type N-terminal cleavage/methylation domain-containing protein
MRCDNAECRYYLPRQGFTIVELLVTLAVMAALAAMTVFAMGPLQDRSAVSGGAAMLQTWLNTARQRAIRDKTQAGLRFIGGNSLPTQTATTSPNPFYVDRMVYLEGGADLFGTLYVPQGSATSSSTTFTLTSALPPSPPFPQVTSTSGDILVVNNGAPHLITASTSTTSLTIAFGWPSTIQSTAPQSFRIIRQPTNISTGADSDNILTMPRGSCVNFNPVTTNPLYAGGIDLGNYAVNGNASNTSTYVPTVLFNKIKSLDILFGPDGTVVAPVSTNPIVFWVCSTTAVNPQQPPPNGILDPIGNPTYTAGTPVLEAMRGNPSLVAITPRTGQVISYPVEIDQISVGGTIRANATKDVQ